VRIFWDNAASYQNLQLVAVRLQALRGADANANGIDDWAELLLQRTCGIEDGAGTLLANNATVPSVLTSFTSPYCLEGRGGYLSMMSISDSVQPRPGAGTRWFADVALSPSNAIPLVVSFQNDGLVVSNYIIWKPTVLPTATNMSIRLADALLLNAAPSNGAPGRMSISIAGVTNYITAASRPVVHRFDQVGEFDVVGTYQPPVGAPQVASITVRVVAASFGSRPACWAERQRFWDCPDLPPDALVEYDSRLQLEESANSAPVPRKFSATIDNGEPRGIVARIGSGGPIVASTQAAGFRLFTGSEANIRIVEKYDDGSQLVEMGLVMSPVLPDVTVRLEVIVGGVVFDDGTILKELSAADFDELGQAKVRFIRPATSKTSVCHTTSAWQNGVLIGIH